MAIWGLVPVQPFEEGKSRLGAILSGPQRAALNQRFFRRTLRLVAGAVGLRHTIVISRSPAVLRQARAAGALALRERRPWGLNSALEQGAKAARRSGASGVLSVSCDLPALTAGDLRRMLALAGRSGMVIAPDHAGLGTNAVILSPAGRIPYRHGTDSFAAHLRAGRIAGRGPRIVRRPGLAADIDTPSDFAGFFRSEP